MPFETPYLHAALSSLPTDLSAKLLSLCDSSSNEVLLDGLVRFISGAECSSSLSSSTRDQWSERQKSAIKVLNDLTTNSPENKRRRDDDNDPESDSQTSKRQRLVANTGVDVPMNGGSAGDDIPLFTLHSISFTSPVRKRADVTVHKSSLKLTNPSTHAIDATIPLSSICRAFIVPTRGKSKPHWSVILLSSDMPDRGKPSSATAQVNPQVIFGLDAIAPSQLTTRSYDSASDGAVHVVPKGDPTLPSIRKLLSHLKVPTLEPTTDVFKSACATIGNSAGEGGIPGIQAYRGAKPGNLWFMQEGLLWGEGKPCEFWSVEDLIGKSEGLRLVGGTGRTCTVIVTRKSSGEEDVAEDGEDVGVETEFGLVDSREQQGINQWVRHHRHLFGKKKIADQSGNPITIKQIEEDSDDDDEDFEADSDVDEDGDDGSSSDTSEEGEVGSEGSGGSVKEAEESDAEGSDEEELKEENHPLMRPGAMPKMSRAAMDMVVDMVEGDLMGATVGAGSEEEEDELED